MKKYIYIMLLYFSVALTAQKKSNIRITYEVKLTTHKSDADLTSEQKRYNFFAKKAGSSIYILEINNEESCFYMDEKMTLDKDNKSKLISAFVGNGQYFYNNKSNKSLNIKSALGEDFLIESIVKNKWILSQEKRIISDYTCYKAIIKQKYINRVGETKEKTVVAWYSPELAINIGLKNYHGLPGLTIQLEESNITYVCRSIELNAKVKINKHKSGKVISEKEYNDILKNDFAKKFGLRN